MAAPRPGPREPLERVTSIKVKLGLLVAASVLVAAVLATLGAGTVPAWLSIPVTVLLALGVTQLLAVGMTAPLRQMTAAARRMAGGDYATRVETSSTDEVGELARAFNRMAADLAAVDRQRRELVANVSHELRTPLTGLVAVLENLDDGVSQADPATIRVALEQAERLSALVADLLDLSRVDAGVAALELEDVAARPLLDAVVAAAGTEAGAARRHMSFEVEVDPPGLLLRADRSRLHQLLANLLDNAARHSPSGGVVRVRAGEVDGGWTRIEVADEGPGIAPEDRERAFERFGTLHDSTGHDSTGGGTGLGLAIARWVTDLHGGRIAAVDPVPGETGARFRVELPGTSTARRGEEPTMTTPSAAGRPAPAGGAAPPPPASPRPAAPPAAPPGSVVDAAFGSLWVDRGVPGRRGVLLACLGLGLLAGLTLPFVPPGAAAALVLLGSGGMVLVLSRRRRSPFTWACAGLAASFAVVVVLRDAAWIVTLGLLTGALLTTTALTGARRAGAMLAGAVAWPLAGLRGLPWLGRTLRAFGGSSGAAAVVRTTLVSVLAVLVFGALFASGDAIFGHWVSVVVPDVEDGLLLRLFVAVAVAGTVLAAAYLSLNPPGLEPAESLAVSAGPTQHRYEWLAPVLLVDAVFVLFLAAQAAAFFGGHDYVRASTGLTYADYVHQGFGQLTFATLLTLLVVWAAARKAGSTRADRAWLRSSLGGLCVLTLVVVASALHRMDLYQEAYGFTRLRVLVDVFETWLGLLVLAVLVAGIRLRGDWLPRAALLSGAAMLLGLAVVDPDAWIARHNLERYETSGKVDWTYLRGLSADATPVLAALDEPDRSCALAGHEPRRDGWAGWNLARHRAADLLEARPADPSPSCEAARPATR